MASKSISCGTGENGSFGSPTKQTRRDVLKSIAALPAARLGAIMAPSVASILTVTPAQAQVIELISVCLSIYSSFTSDDGGLSATMQAQLAKLDLIIDQLDQIQKSLLQLSKDLPEIRDFVTALPNEILIKNLVSKLSGSVSLYKELASSVNCELDALRSPKFRPTIESVFLGLIDARSQLVAEPYAKNMAVAFTAPSAMAVEMLSRQILQHDSRQIRAALQQYQLLFESMFDEQYPNSITSITKSLRVKLDASWEQKKDQSSILKLSKYSYGGPDTRVLAVVRLRHCHRSNPLYACTEERFFARKGYALALKSIDRGAIREDVIEKTVSPLVSVAADVAFPDVKMPVDESLTMWRPVNSANLPTDAARDAAITSSSQYATLDQRIKELEQYFKSEVLNQKMQLAVCAIASISAQNSLDVVKKKLRSLK